MFTHRLSAAVYRTERAARGQVVVTVADHEVGVTLDDGALITVLHSALEELSSRLRSGSGVKAKLGDPDRLSVKGVGVLNVLDETCEGFVISLAVEMDVGSMHDGARAHRLELLEPRNTHGLAVVRLNAVGDGRTDDGDLRMCGSDGVQVLCPGSASSLGGQVALFLVITLVETHDSLGALLDGLVNIGEPLLRRSLLRASDQGNEVGADVVTLGLGPVVAEAKLGTNGFAEAGLIVGKTTLGTGVGVARAGGGRGLSGRGGGRDTSNR
jgi:hypothetical protein